MDLKDAIIRQLAARIANDTIQLANVQAQLEMMKHEKESEANATTTKCVENARIHEKSESNAEQTSNANKAL